MAALTPPPLDNSLGVISIGVVVSAAIYGLTCLQTYNYFQQQAKEAEKDSVLLRASIVVLWIIESLHSACIAHALYFYSVSHYGDYASLQRAVWSIILPTGLTSLVGSIVQACFAWRVYIMSDKNKPLVSLIALGSIIQLVTGWVMTGLGFKYRLFADLGHFKALITTSWTTTAVTDVVITISLCYYFHNRRSGIKRCHLSYFRKSNIDTYQSTDNLIQKLIIYTINGGVLCSVGAIVALLTYLTMPENLVNIAVNFILGKAYSNSLLSSLNARTNLREANERGFSLDFVDSGPAFASQQPSGGVAVTTVFESNAGNQKGIYAQGHKIAHVV
ncbi:hypothetical protein MVEN_02249800 [Mycena venus]|uniref:DUF6534 domain-containing protein n=1 Tax=Mycena venus TaxID=2733690 RepID=A0A8H6X6P4_9AGAR|nr:hypothetical protein MVEN_02249800 [Mycena venus]